MNLNDIPIPAHLEAAIATPHAYEGPNNRPLWLIWKHEPGQDGLSDPPAIDCVCDTDDYARYCVRAILESSQARQSMGLPEITVWIERIPANHRFASTMADVFSDHTLTQVKAMRRFRRDGD